jgi:hypothetical protein
MEAYLKLVLPEQAAPVTFQAIDGPIRDNLLIGEAPLTWTAMSALLWGAALQGFFVIPFSLTSKLGEALSGAVAFFSTATEASAFI